MVETRIDLRAALDGFGDGTHRGGWMRDLVHALNPDPPDALHDGVVRTVAPGEVAQQPGFRADGVQIGEAWVL